MKLHPRSRRAFLQGLGGASLAIPFLPSLAGKAAAAEASPLRFAMMYYPYGNAYQNWWDNPMATGAPSGDGSYRTQALSSIPGQLSTILGAPYDGSIRKKLAVVRGLDPLGIPCAHNSTFATMGDSGQNGPNNSRIYQFGYSVDAVLEDSPRFYPTRPALGALRTAARLASTGLVGSWSYTSKNGAMQSLPKLSDVRAIYDAVFNGGGQLDPQSGARIARFKDITSVVHQDFKQTLANRRISAHDKLRLENFAALVAQIQGKLSAPVVTCSRSAGLEARIGSLDSYAKIMSVVMDMEVAALACGTTKIVMHGITSYGPSLADDNRAAWHDMAHAGGGRLHAVSLAKSQYQAGLFADFITKMDAITEADGNTLLDNTLVMYRSEDSSGGHFLMDTPCLVAGAKGKIKTDLYINYQRLDDPLKGNGVGVVQMPSGQAYFGRPYNNMLITVLKAMGLTQPEYTKYPNQDGFGRYDPAGYAQTGSNYAQFTSTSSARNAPLPGLWAGG